jgi:hypothetical protein
LFDRVMDSDSPGGRITSITERDGNCHETAAAVSSDRGTRSKRREGGERETDRKRRKRERE